MMDDCISRQAAIAYAISGRVRTLPTSEDGENWIRTEDVRQSLSTMPSANKSGHWVMNPSEVAGDGYYICSNCNNDVYDATDFCPNCGSYNGGENYDKG